MLAPSAQTNIYGYSGGVFSGSETNITQPLGTYIITAYGASGGRACSEGGGPLYFSDPQSTTNHQRFYRA